MFYVNGEIEKADKHGFWTTKEQLFFWATFSYQKDLSTTYPDTNDKTCCFFMIHICYIHTYNIYIYIAYNAVQYMILCNHPVVVDRVCTFQKPSRSYGHILDENLIFYLSTLGWLYVYIYMYTHVHMIHYIYIYIHIFIYIYSIPSGNLT